MNRKFYLFKFLPLLTFIILLFPTTKMAKAASSESLKETATIQKFLTQESYSETYIAAAPKGDQGYGESKSTKKIVLSEKAKKIEFIVFASIMGLGVLAPEIFFKSKKNQQVSHSEDRYDIERETVKAKKLEKPVEPDLEFLKVISEKAKDTDSFFNKSAESNGKVGNQTNSKSA